MRTLPLCLILLSTNERCQIRRLRGCALLVDALERHEVEALEDVETGTLIDLYTLLSDVQRDADDPQGNC